MTGATAGLRAALEEAKEQGRDPADVLRRLTDFYVDQTLDQPGRAAP